MGNSMETKPNGKLRKKNVCFKCAIKIKKRLKENKKGQKVKNRPSCEEFKNEQVVESM